MKLLGMLDMAEAIAGFLHLSLFFDLKYPQVIYMFFVLIMLREDLKYNTGY